MKTTRVALAACLLGCFAPGARAEGTPLLAPPVDAAIARPFQDPVGPYGPGHRGIDYAVPVGTRIRAAAAGTVTFAGSVAGELAVTIAHDGGVRTTYSVLSQVMVQEGHDVQQGQWIGASGVTHPGQAAGLHFGVKIGDRYIDPMRLLGATDITQALHLAPLAWRPVPGVARLLAAPPNAGDYREPCSQPAALAGSLPPPDRNVAVAIAGIGSKTAGGASSELYRLGPARLGYRRDRVFRFSYRGIRGPHLHRPYRSTDTFGDLRLAARKLRVLLRAVARRFPGAAVDLFAHSQGGIVARLFLASKRAAWDPRLPRIDHLVTLASPNEGAPLAGIVPGLRSNPLGSLMVDAASRWARAGGPLPDPRSAAVSELAPGSTLLRGLARQDVAYGTQVLTLASPTDFVVPTVRAGIPGKINRIVPPRGLFTHAAILDSDAARRIEYSFLRGGPIACRGWWDQHGRQLGAGLDWMEGHLGGAVSIAARAVLGRGW